MSDESTLYDRLGGSEAIEAVVDAFYERVLADEQLTHHFEGTDVGELRAHQRAFIGSVTGGPVEYDGRDVRDGHADLDLTRRSSRPSRTTSTRSSGSSRSPGDREAVLELVASLEDDILADSRE